MIIKPKILVLAHEQYLNGASHSLITILEGLRVTYEFLVIVPDTGLMVDELKRIGVNYEILHLPRCAYFNYISFQNHLEQTIKYYRNKSVFERKLLLISQDFLPDLIYTNTSVLSFGYDLSKIIKKPHVWHVREYGDKHFAISYIPSKKSIINRIKKSNVSIFTTHILKKKWLGLKDNNSLVIYNGVLERQGGFFKEKNTHIITIGVVAMILGFKNQLFAIEVFKECYKKNNNLRLNFYGGILDHNYYESLKKSIEINELSNVVNFLGYTDNTLIYKEIDVLMSCSQNEAFGRTLIEAMSHKIPVLAMNVGGPSEILNDNSELTLFNTIDEAVTKLDHLINDSSWYKKSSEAGYTLAMNHFYKESYIQRVAIVFNKLINEKK